MRVLNLILMLVGALAVLGLSVAPASAEPAPCHEMAAMADGTAATQTPPAPDRPVSGKATMGMACCVGCVAPAQPRAVVRTRSAAPAPAARPRPQRLPSGRSPAPEPGPPKG